MVEEDDDKVMFRDSYYTTGCGFINKSRFLGIHTAYTIFYINGNCSEETALKYVNTYIIAFSRHLNCTNCITRVCFFVVQQCCCVCTTLYSK